MSVSYSFKTFKKHDEVNFHNTLIWIFYATKTPPHIGISTKERLFSLKVKGKDENIYTNRMLKTVQLKKIPTVIVELNNQLAIKKLKDEYILYDHITSGKNTCLTPIKNILKCTKAQQLSELLHFINERINICAGLHLPDNYNTLPNYSTTEINNRIEQLKRI